MPSLNLRLTDEQHASLQEAAHTNRRSMQREIVHRCFSEFPGAQDAAREIVNDVLAETTKRIEARPFRGPHLKPSKRAKA